jgi:hypothetical protein
VPSVGDCGSGGGSGWVAVVPFDPPGQGGHFGAGWGVAVAVLSEIRRIWRIVGIFFFFFFFFGSADVSVTFGTAAARGVAVSGWQWYGWKERGSAVILVPVGVCGCGWVAVGWQLLTFFLSCNFFSARDSLKLTPFELYLRHLLHLLNLLPLATCHLSLATCHLPHLATTCHT